MSDLNLKPYDPLYPMRIHPYEELLKDQNASVIDKINSIIDYLNSVGKLTNDVVKNWNTVYNWTMNDGLKTGINNKLEDMLAKGEFDTIINTVVTKIGDITTLTTTDKSNLTKAINELVSKIGDLTTLTTPQKDTIVHSINSLQSEVTTNTNNIGTNTANIATNTANIATNASQLADIVTFIKQYPTVGGETTSTWVNRVITTVSGSGIKKLAMEKGQSYTIDGLITIPDGFQLDLNKSTFNVNTDIDGFLAGSKSSIINGSIMVNLATYSKTVLKFQYDKPIEECQYSDLLIQGVYNGNISGTAIDLYGNSYQSYFVYNRFENITIKHFEYGIRIRISDIEVNGNGAWINANSFLNVRINHVKKMVHFEGTGWGINGAKRETSGNIFQNLELQLSSIVESALKINGTGNYFHGYLWDESLVTGTTITCNDLAQNNVIHFPTMDTSKQNINSVKNRVFEFGVGYGVPSNFNRSSIPYTFGQPTYAGNQDDYLAYADLRYPINMLNGSPVSTSIKNMFSPDGTATYWTGLVDNTLVKFEIDCSAQNIQYLQRLGIVFDTSPKTLKISLISDTDVEKVLLNTTTVNQYFYLADNVVFMTANTKKIVIEMTSNGTALGITKLFGVATQKAGQAYLTKRNDKTYGDLEFDTTNIGVILKSPNGSRYRLKVSDTGTLSAVLI